MIEHLPRVVPASSAGTSAAGPDHPMRRVTRQIAFEPGGWTPERAAKVAAVFEELAPEWHTRAGEFRLEVVAEACSPGRPHADWHVARARVGDGPGDSVAGLRSLVGVSSPSTSLRGCWPGLRPVPAFWFRADGAHLPGGGRHPRRPGSW